MAEVHEFSENTKSKIERGMKGQELVNEIQWNLRIKDNLGPGILSVVRRLVSLGGQPIFSLKMP